MSLVSIKAAQERLGDISRTTIERLIKTGQLPVVRIGARVFICDSALDEFVEKRSEGKQLITA